jgi:hypothetical protein
MACQRASTLACIILLAAIPVTQAQIEPLDKEEQVRTVMITLALGDTIWFNFLQGIVQSMGVVVGGGAIHEVPLATCMRLENVRFESLRFILGQHDRRKEGTFTILFSMGTKKDRRFGSLPMVQLNFYKWQFVDPLITTQTGPHSSLSIPLCYGVPQRVPP